MKVAPALKAGIATGSYWLKLKNGMNYFGKGSVNRMRESARRLEKMTGDAIYWGKSKWNPAKGNCHKQAFKDEAAMLKADGGPKSPTNLNKIESPGAKY